MEFSWQFALLLLDFIPPGLPWSQLPCTHIFMHRPIGAICW